EASGGYEKFVFNLLNKSKFNVSIVNAKRVREFAKAGGKLAKKDCIDACVIRRFGQTFNPGPQARVSKEEEQRTEMLTRRRQLVRNIALEKQQAEHASKDIKKRIEKHIRFLEEELEWIRNKLKMLFNKDAVLKAKLEKLDKIKGVGEVTAMDILIDMP